MKAKRKCEICGYFKTVGFTDCGLICEECFNKEVQISAFNYGIEVAAKIADGYCDPNMAKFIREAKKQEHKKNTGKIDFKDKKEPKP